MIEVLSQLDGLTITGHAGAGPPGHDLVCAAVSTLVQTLVSSIAELTDDNIESDLRPGVAEIQYRNLSAQGRLLMDSFFVGVSGVAQAFPVCVRIRQLRGVTEP